MAVILSSDRRLRPCLPSPLSKRRPLRQGLESDTLTNRLATRRSRIAKQRRVSWADRATPPIVPRTARRPAAVWRRVVLRRPHGALRKLSLPHRPPDDQAASRRCRPGSWARPRFPGRMAAPTRNPAPWEPSPKKTPKAVAVAIAVGGCLVVAAAVFCMVAVGADVLARAADGFAQLRQEAASSPDGGRGRRGRADGSSLDSGRRPRWGRGREGLGCARRGCGGHGRDGRERASSWMGPVRRATRLRKRRSPSSSTRT